MGVHSRMPSEVRIIVFTSEEVLDAVEQFSETLDTPLFRGKPSDLHVRKSPQVRAILEVERAGGEEIETVDLNSSHLAAALITFCRKRRIPLPRNAKKELDIIEDQLVLRLEVGSPSQALIAALKFAS